MVSLGGRNIGIEIENTYDYLGQTFDSMESFTDFLNYNLNMASDINEYKTDVAAIGDEIVKIAKEFVITNGTYRTGRLHDSIHWIPKSKGIQLVADAKEGDRHYAGHIEYGFVGRDGLPYGPWPFLRPAMRIGAEASTGRLADAMANRILRGKGFASTPMSFGRYNIHSVLAASGGRHNVVNRVRESYNGGAIGKSRYGANQTRWSKAGHGINYTGKIDSNSDEGRIFANRFGPALSRDEFRRGSL